MAGEAMSSRPRGKKPDLEKTLTIYGRKAVLEALEDNTLTIHALHLADSNRRAAILETIKRLADARQVPVYSRDRLELSRLSRNKKQDQGVALDLVLPKMMSLESLTRQLDTSKNPQFIALDGITNPQNLGMIIRSVAASGIDGLILPSKGCAAIGPLTIKASAGTVFKCPLVRCDTLVDALRRLAERVSVCAMDARAEQTLATIKRDRPRVFVLGNETEGLSREILKVATEHLGIPMANDVESLNVAVTAALIAFAIAR